MSIQLRHLSPLTLRCEFPADYPEASPPDFTLACGWLSAAQLSKLALLLDEEWAAELGNPVGYSWAELLRERSWEALGLGESLVLEGPRPAAGGGGAKVDHRVIPLGGADVMQQLQQLLGYDSLRAKHVFSLEYHTCEICYDDKQGVDFTLLGVGGDCDHMFCTECLSTMMAVHVTEGSVERLLCPDCVQPLHPAVVASLLDAEQLARYETITLQKTLDRMPDLVYCPKCERPTIEDARDHFAQCAECTYSFCTLCSEAFHPSVECMDPTQRLKVLAARTSGNKDMGKEEKRRYDQLMAEAMNLAHIQKTSKRCPSCKMAIEKDHGCNKMTCGTCGTYFCWKCVKPITGYEHFYAGGDCVLFDQAEIDHWNRQQVRPAAGDLHAGRYAGHAARIGGGPLRMRSCPRCRQRNAKDGRNNHMSCWNCLNNFCYQCNAVLRKGHVASHWGPTTPCKQHSDD